MTCFITNCKSRSSRMGYEKEYISFHQMPSDETVKQKWCKIIPRAQRSWSKYSRICSKHFRKDCFLHENDSNRRRLKTNAVPSLFLNDKLCDSVSTKSGHLPPLAISKIQQESKTKSKSVSWNTDNGDSAKVPKSHYKDGQEQRHSSDDIDKENGQLQEGYYCNVCRNAINGYRYICVHCPDFDLCGGCEAQGEHALHYMLRVPEMRHEVEVMYVLETIREHLFKDENSIESSIVIESVKSEIKQEPDFLGMDKNDINLSESWEKQLFNEEYSVQEPKTEETEETEYITNTSTPKRTSFQREKDLPNTKKYVQYVPHQHNTRSMYGTTYAETLSKKSGVTKTVPEFSNTSRREEFLDKVTTTFSPNVSNVTADSENMVVTSESVTSRLLHQMSANFDKSVITQATFSSNALSKDAGKTAVTQLTPENIACSYTGIGTQPTQVTSVADNFNSASTTLTTAAGMRESGNIKPLPQRNTPEKPCYLVLELSNSDTEKKIKINVKRISPDKNLPWDQKHLQP